MAVLDNFSDACARRDLEDVFRLFASDADIVVVASEAGQRWSGTREVKAFFERLFSRPVAYSFSWDWYRVWSAGSVAWVMTEGAEHLKGEHQQASFPYRISAVLERRREEWRRCSGRARLHSPRAAPRTARTATRPARRRRGRSSHRLLEPAASLLRPRHYFTELPSPKRYGKRYEVKR
jgi:ketosteroid isomerase-like protein